VRKREPGKQQLATVTDGSETPTTPTLLVAYRLKGWFVIGPRRFLREAATEIATQPRPLVVAVFRAGAGDQDPDARTPRPLSVLSTLRTLTGPPSEARLDGERRTEATGGRNGPLTNVGALAWLLAVFASV
jgi:hypothetical protein